MQTTSPALRSQPPLSTTSTSPSGAHRRSAPTNLRQKACRASKPSKPPAANSATSPSFSSAAANSGSGARLNLSSPTSSSPSAACASRPDSPSPSCSRWPSASAPTPRSSASSTASFSSRFPIPIPIELVALWLDAPGAAGLANFEAGLRLSPSMYFTFAEHNHASSRSASGSRAPRMSPASHNPSRLARWSISDGVLQTPRHSSGGRPLVFSAADQDPQRRQDGDAQLRLLAAALRRRPRRDRPQHPGRRANARDCRRDAARLPCRRSTTSISSFRSL